MRQFFYLLKITFMPPGVSFGGLKGADVDKDEMGLVGIQAHPTPVC